MKQLIKRKLIAPILDLLRRGVSPSQLALAATLGILVAIVPVFGAGTLLCLLAIWLFKVNPVAILLVNQFAYPLQFVCYLPFIQAGNWLFQADSFTFSLADIFGLFASDWLAAIGVLWWATMRALVVWFLIAIPSGMTLHWTFKKILLPIHSRIIAVS